jgi:hypothetical protein
MASYQAIIRSDVCVRCTLAFSSSSNVLEFEVSERADLDICATTEAGLLLVLEAERYTSGKSGAVGSSWSHV